MSVRRGPHVFAASALDRPLEPVEGRPGPDLAAPAQVDREAPDLSSVTHPVPSLARR